MPGTPEEVTATAAHADDMAGFPEGMPGTPEEVTATAAHADDMAGFPEGMPGTPEEVTATAAHTDDMAGFPDGMLCEPEDVTATADTSDGVADFSDGVADTPDDGADSQEDGQVDFGLPLSALQAGIEEKDQLKEDAATTTGRRAAPSSSAAVASPSSLSTTPGGDSVTETVVAAREAIVSTGRMAVGDEKEKQLKMEKQLEKEKQLKMEKQLEMEKQLKMEKQLEMEKQLKMEKQLEKEKWLEAKEKRLKEKEKQLEEKENQLEKRKDEHIASAVPPERWPPPSGNAIRHAALEVDQVHDYLTDKAMALRQAIEMRDEKQIKSYRRALTSAMLRMKEVVTRAVQSRRWDPSLVAEFMQDVDGVTSDLLKSANAMLMQLDQKMVTKWANSCAPQGRQVMNLAAEAHELLTTDSWTLEECNEFMGELDKESGKLKDLYRQFLTNKLSIAMKRKAANLQNEVDMEMARARGVVQRLITAHEEKQWTSSRSRTPPPRYSRSSHAHSSSREHQPREAQPDPVLQGVLDCLTSIHGYMWRMAEGSGKTGGPDWSTGLAQRPTTASTPSPIDATRSGSVGGKHGKGKGTRKNANAVPVQRGNKVKKSARANRYPARIRGSKQASNPAQKHGLASKPAQERSQETLSRKRSPEQDAAARSEGGYEHPRGYDPAGPHADRRAEALEIPGLRSQEERCATGATRIVGVGTSGNDGVSSLAQVTSATTAPKDGTRQSTNNTTSPALAPKKKKKSGVKKRRASPSPGQGEVLQVNDEPDETPRQAYKKPARQQVLDQQGVPARQQVPSQQPRPTTSQAPMGKRGRMERAQRQAAGRAATPFQTTRPPDGQRRDGLTN
jgi:hypothetical protein